MRTLERTLLRMRTLERTLCRWDVLMPSHTLLASACAWLGDVALITSFAGHHGSSYIHKNAKQATHVSYSQVRPIHSCSHAGIRVHIGGMLRHCPVHVWSIDASSPCSVHIWLITTTRGASGLEGCAPLIPLVFDSCSGRRGTKRLISAVAPPPRAARLFFDSKHRCSSTELELELKPMNRNAADAKHV
jgi:hypothetical protein